MTTSVECRVDADRAAIEAIAQGDRSGLAHLYDRHAGVMLRVACRVLKRRRDAEDLLHDVFLEAWHKASSYDARRGSVRGWLLLRVRSRAIDRLRTLQVMRAHAHRAAAPDAGVAAAPDTAGTHYDGELARTALGQLSGKQQRVVELGYFKGLTCREIAAECGIPLGTVKSRLSAGLSNLRRQLRCPPEGV